MKQLTILTALCAALILCLAGCTSIESDDATARLTTQYATLRLIEQSSDITASGVIAHVERVRAIVQHDSLVSTAALVEQVMAGINTESLAPSDRLLLLALIEYAAAHLEEVSLVSDDRMLSVLTLLTWIEQAARMAG